jgi:hypothetical protein
VGNRGAWPERNARRSQAKFLESAFAGPSPVRLATAESLCDALVYQDFSTDLLEHQAKGKAMGVTL